MSKPITTRRSLAVIADEAIEQIGYDREHARWLAALISTIGTQLDHGCGIPEVRIERVKDLANLAQYLADDLANYTETRIADLQQQLNDAEELAGALKTEGGVQ